MRKRIEVTAKSGATAGVEKKSATSGAAATPPPAHAAPAARVVQNAVERSFSVIVRRAISACPNDRSVNTDVTPTNRSAIEARPKSRGTSSRASAMPTTILVVWTTTCVAIFQPMPLTTCCRSVAAAAAGISGRTSTLVVLSSFMLFVTCAN